MIELYPAQKKILIKLISLPKPRFSQLRSDDMENDLLNYHIKFLVKKGYVIKEHNLYSLTNKGTKYVSNLEVDGGIDQLFKVSVALFLFDGDKILVQKRRRKPFLNCIATIAGKVKWGESIEDAAKRKLFQESGLIADFKFIGVLRKTRILSNKEIVEDTIYHTCYSNKYEGELVKKNMHGENFWLEFPEAMKVFKSNPDLGRYDIKVIRNLMKKDFSTYYFHQKKQISMY